MNIFRKPAKPLWNRRRGAHAVEFAIAAPILFLFVLSSMEYGRMHMVRNTLDNAVYEGTRRGLVLNATNSDVTTTVNGILSAARVNGATTTCTITNDLVTVSCSVPMNSNSWVTPLFFKDRSITSSLTLNRR